MAAETNLEREFKFDVDPGFDPPDLRPLVGRVERLPEQHLTTTYFDTRDRRLWGRGITLRLRVEREGDGPDPVAGKWTLKLPVAPGAEPGDAQSTWRSELTWKGSLSEVPPEARATVAGLVRRSPLERVVELRTDRRRLLLHAGSGPEGAGPWGEIDDDLVTVASGPRQGLRFRQLELELLDGGSATREADRIVEVLRRSGAAPGGASKFALAAGLEDGPGERDGTRRSGAGARADAADVPSVVKSILASDLDRLLDWDCRLRIAEPGGDPAALDAEAVHQARVAARRLRADVRTLSPVLDPVWVRHVRSDLKWLGGLLGRLRDEDVLVGRIRGHGDGAGAGRDAEAVEELVALVRRDRHLGATELRQAVDSDRYLDVLERVHAASEAPPLHGAPDDHPAGAPLEPTLTSIVAARWRVVVAEVDQIGPRPDDEALHQLRVRAKRLRYACEATGPYLGKRSRHAAAAARRLQSVLGRIHDAGVASRALRELASHPSVTPDVAFVAGRIAGLAEAEAARHRGEWRRAAKDVSRAPIAKWLA